MSILRFIWRGARLRKNAIGIREFLEQLRQLVLLVISRLKLMDILVQPMQRLTKYGLLLKAILRNTDDDVERDNLNLMVGNPSLMPWLVLELF